MLKPLPPLPAMTLPGKLLVKAQNGGRYEYFDSHSPVTFHTSEIARFGKRRRYCSFVTTNFVELRDGRIVKFVVSDLPKEVAKIFRKYTDLVPFGGLTSRDNPVVETLGPEL